ncbi:hypothetical protein CA833_17150 [Novosphingobium sp. KA1]|nr:hypothetical protein CA833_17150 [Novosphingobium sp. KA1]
MAWSLSDLAAPDQSKVEVVDRDDGNAGWRLEAVAVRSYDPLSLALPARLIDDHDTARFRTRHFSASAWHALGDHDTLRFTAVAGRTSRRTDDAVVLPAKTLTGFAGAQLAWEHARTWSFSIGPFRQGGWGGRSLESDLLHFSHGEPPAARGLKASWRMSLQGNNNDGAGRGIWVGLDSRLGTRAAGLGGALAQSALHDSRLGLVLAAQFWSRVAGYRALPSEQAPALSPFTDQRMMSGGVLCWPIPGASGRFINGSLRFSKSSFSAEPP